MGKNIILTALMSILLVIITLTAVSIILIYNQDFYKQEFNKYKIYEKYENADKISSNLLQYFKNNEGLIEVYDNEEIIHLKDVKKIINTTQKILHFSILIFLTILSILIYKKYKKLHLIFISAAITIIILITITYAFSSVDFSKFFENFHRTIFTNDLWLLDQNSLLVNIFPEQLFMDALNKILIYSLFTSMVFLILGLYLIKYFNAEYTK